MIHAWHAFFSWPDGGVWANLLAAGLWALPAFTTHHVLMRRHHTKTTDAQTAQIKAHIDERMGARSAQEGNPT